MTNMAFSKRRINAAPKTAHSIHRNLIHFVPASDMELEFLQLVAARFAVWSLRHLKVGSFH